MASRLPSSVSTQASNDQGRSGAEFNQWNDVQPFPGKEAGSAEFNNAEIEFPERKDVVQMYKSIRSWAIFSLVLGVISIFANRTLDPVWGVIMCLVALLSWRIKIPAMFIIYSIVMGWAALINGLSILLGGQVYWVFLSLMQIYWTITIVLQYRKYRKLRLVELYQAGKWPERLDPPQKEAEISKKLAFVGAILAGICLILLPFTCGGTILVSALHNFRLLNK